MSAVAPMPRNVIRVGAEVSEYHHLVVCFAYLGLFSVVVIGISCFELQCTFSDFSVVKCFPVTFTAIQKTRLTSNMHFLKWFFWFYVKVRRQGFFIFACLKIWCSKALNMVRQLRGGVRQGIWLGKGLQPHPTPSDLPPIYTFLVCAMRCFTILGVFYLTKTKI